MKVKTDPRRLASPPTHLRTKQLFPQPRKLCCQRSLFVCLSVGLHQKKNAEWDSTKLGGGMRRGPRKSPLNLAARLEKEAASFSCLDSKRSKRMDDLFRPTNASHNKTHVSSKDKSQHYTLSAVMMQGCWDVTLWQEYAH